MVLGFETQFEILGTEIMRTDSRVTSLAAQVQAATVSSLRASHQGMLQHPDPIGWDGMGWHAIGVFRSPPVRGPLIISSFPNS